MTGLLALLARESYRSIGINSTALSFNSTTLAERKTGPTATDIGDEYFVVVLLFIFYNLGF